MDIRLLDPKVREEARSLIASMQADLERMMASWGEYKREYGYESQEVVPNSGSDFIESTNTIVSGKVVDDEVVQDLQLDRVFSSPVVFDEDFDGNTVTIINQREVEPLPIVYTENSDDEDGVKDFQTYSFSSPQDNILNSYSIVPVESTMELLEIHPKGKLSPHKLDQPSQIEDDIMLKVSSKIVTHNSNSLYDFNLPTARESICLWASAVDWLPCQNVIVDVQSIGCDRVILPRVCGNSLAKKKLSPSDVFFVPENLTSKSPSAIGNDTIFLDFMDAPVSVPVASHVLTVNYDPVIQFKGGIVRNVEDHGGTSLCCLLQNLQLHLFATPQGMYNWGFDPGIKLTLGNTIKVWVSALLNQREWIYLQSSVQLHSPTGTRKRVFKRVVIFFVLEVWTFNLLTSSYSDQHLIIRNFQAFYCFFRLIIPYFDMSILYLTLPVNARGAYIFWILFTMHSIAVCGALLSLNFQRLFLLHYMVSFVGLEKDNKFVKPVGQGTTWNSYMLIDIRTTLVVIYSFIRMCRGGTSFAHQVSKNGKVFLMILLLQVRCHVRVQDTSFYIFRWSVGVHFSISYMYHLKSEMPLLQSGQIIFSQSALIHWLCDDVQCSLVMRLLVIALVHSKLQLHVSIWATWMAVTTRCEDEPKSESICTYVEDINLLIFRIDKAGQYNYFSRFCGRILIISAEYKCFKVEDGFCVLRLCPLAMGFHLGMAAQNYVDYQEIDRHSSGVPNSYVSGTMIYSAVCLYYVKIKAPMNQSQQFCTSLAAAGNQHNIIYVIFQMFWTGSTLQGDVVIFSNTGVKENVALVVLPNQLVIQIHNISWGPLMSLPQEVLAEKHGVTLANLYLPWEPGPSLSKLWVSSLNQKTKEAECKGYAGANCTILQQFTPTLAWRFFLWKEEMDVNRCPWMHHSVLAEAFMDNQLCGVSQSLKYSLDESLIHNTAGISTTPLLLRCCIYCYDPGPCLSQGYIEMIWVHKSRGTVYKFSLSGGYLRSSDKSTMCVLVITKLLLVRDKFTDVIFSIWIIWHIAWDTRYSNQRLRNRQLELSPWSSEQLTMSRGKTVSQWLLWLLGIGGVGAEMISGEGSLLRFLGIIAWASYDIYGPNHRPVQEVLLEDKDFFKGEGNVM